MATYPPYSDEALQYYLWGLRKGFLAPDVEVPDIDIPKEQADLYSQGLVEGENYAAYGYPIATACYELREGHTLATVAAEGLDLGLEAYGIFHTLKKANDAAAIATKAGDTALASEIVEAGVLGAAAEGGLLLLMASIAVTTHYNLPIQAYDPSQVDELISFLQQVKEPLSLELFVGGGVDYDAGGCQLQMTNIYKNADYARQAIAAMGRPASILLSVRTDMSGGLRVVEQSGQFYE